MMGSNKGLARWLIAPLLLVACSEESSMDQEPGVPLAGTQVAPTAGATPLAGTPVADPGAVGGPVAGTTGGLPQAGAPAAGAMTDAPVAGMTPQPPLAGTMDAPPEAGAPAEPSPMDDPAQTAWALPPIDDYTADGPFSTTMESNVGPSSNYTIFRPEPLGTDGFLHPIITFGPGILTTPGNYNTLLSHLATHGYVSIVVNSLSASPGSPANVDAMQTGLDWMIAQNAEAGTYQGKLAVDRAVPMGYSLGATASVQLSSHPAVITTVSIHGHQTSGDPHGPVLLLTGTDDVIDSVRQTMSTLEEAPAMLAALPIGHLAVLGELGGSGRYVAPITAWLRYWVNGDDAAKSFFWGADCAMCSSPWIEPETNAAWTAQSL